MTYRISPWTWAGSRGATVEAMVGDREGCDERIVVRKGKGGMCRSSRTRLWWIWERQHPITALLYVLCMSGGSLRWLVLRVLEPN